MKRRVGAPLRLSLLLLVFAALPVSVLVTSVDADAKKSVAHVAICFVVLMGAFRVIGKRELGRLSPFELVTLMVIPEILSNSLQGEGSLLPSLAGLCAVLFLVLALSTLSQRFETVQNVVEPSPTLLVADGKLLEQNMNLERIAPHELLSEMRKQGLQQIAEVRFAVLEGGGNITFVPYGGGGTARSSDESEIRT